MKNRWFKHALTPIFSVLIWMWLFGSSIAFGASSLIDQAEYSSSQGDTALQIEFRVPVNVLNYAPLERGSLLAINVQALIPPGSEDSLTTGETEWLTVGTKITVTPYESVQFIRTGPDRGQIIVKFRATTDYKVTKSSDSRSVIISIPLLPENTPITPQQEIPEKIEIPTGATDPALALMEEGRQALLNKDYNRAVLYYTEASIIKDSPYSREAKEYLGVAREKNRQLGLAKSVYEEYLREYPEGEATIRVKQRLAGLLSTAMALSTGTGQTQDSTVETPSSEVLPAQETKPQWQVFGSLSEYYRYSDLTITEETLPGTDEEDISQPLEKSLSTDIDVTANLRSDNWSLRSRLSAGYATDFLTDGPGDQKRLRDLYVELTQKDLGFELKGGRQSSSNGGVLGRFDGLSAGLQTSENIKVNLVTGYPVDSTRDTGINTERFFYGINSDITFADSPWQMNVFLIQQEISSIIDRRSVGGELRYVEGRSSIFSLIDYDILFNELNTALLIGNWTSSGNTTYTVTLDWRNSPILTSRNALNGQSVTTIDELLGIYNETTIYQIARDRTADSRLINLSINKPLNDTFQIFLNASQTNYSDTPASAGVEAVPSTGNEYNYDFQLIGSGLIMQNDTQLFGLKYSDSMSSERMGISYDGRFPLTQTLRLSPRLQAELRHSLTDRTDQWIYRASFRLDQRFATKHVFELELGSEWTDRELLNSLSENTKGLFAVVGYRYEF